MAVTVDKLNKEIKGSLSECMPGDIPDHLKEEFFHKSLHFVVKNKDKVYQVNSLASDVLLNNKMQVSDAMHLIRHLLEKVGVELIDDDPERI